MQISGRKFLITGGASQLGSHIAEQLLEEGAGEVVLFDNFSLGSPSTIPELLAHPKVQLVRGDILRSDELMEALDAVSGVFAVAGFLTLPLSQKPSLGLDVNVRGHHNVLEACRWRGVGKVVFSSSVAVYGKPPDEAIDEGHSLVTEGLQPPSALYACSKIIGEQLCRLYETQHGLDCLALRYSTIYGARQHYRGLNALYMIEAYDAIKAGNAPVLPGDGTEVKDYIYVSDVARANVMAMGSDLTGESLNISTGGGVSLNRVVEIILDICGSDLKPTYKTDASKVKFFAARHLHYSCDKARRLLGWSAQVPIEEGIRKLIAWHDASKRS